MSADQTEAVELPTRIVERVEQRLPRTEFDSSGEYIAYVMEEVLYRVNADTADGEFEEVGEDEVRDRLESLGYLNQ
jgi:reverse gyrase